MGRITRFLFAAWTTISSWLLKILKAPDLALVRISRIFATDRAVWWRVPYVALVLIVLLMVGALSEGTVGAWNLALNTKALLLNPAVPLIALAFALLTAVSVQRAWADNETRRFNYANALADDVRPDELPDLRWDAAITALGLMVVFPLLFFQINRITCPQGCVFQGAEHAGWLSWFFLTFDSFYRAVVYLHIPDLYKFRPLSEIHADSSWALHLKAAMQTTFQLFVVSVALQIFKIHEAVRNAVALSLRDSPTLAIRYGRRALQPILARISELDEKDSNNEVLAKNAAIAVAKLGDPRALPMLRGLMQHGRTAHARRRAIEAVEVILTPDKELKGLTCAELERVISCLHDRAQGPDERPTVKEAAERALTVARSAFAALECRA